MASIVSTLPFVLLVSLIITLIFYWFGGKIAPKGTKTPGKLAPYACGEDMPTRKYQISIRRFFLYVTLFLIFDISAFFLALSFSVNNVYPIIFSIIIVSSLLTIIPTIGRK